MTFPIARTVIAGAGLWLAAAAASGALAQAPAAGAPPSTAAPSPAAGPAPATPANPACDAGCVRANADRAVQACAPRIEAEAPGDYEWLLRPYGSIFQEADTPEQASSTVVRYRGDSIRFLSPQKEWLRAIYECGFDAGTRQVAYVRVRIGVLGKRSAVPVAAAAPAPRAPAAAPAATPAATPAAKPAAPGPQAAAPNPAPPAANSSAPQPASINLRAIGEPSLVDVRQIPAGARPPKP
ncbi:hypothetical protein [Methylobacterium terrae]|uniref:hypothetical protein n=1 Tax=Methylobacterium terrae TaxID=2202827 RepID=UPI0013A55DCB|nr:hypothetical protein [Methylobacterium terrae]